MTAAQNKARQNFKKAIAYRKKTGCTLKQAFAAVKSGKVAAIKIIEKGENKNSKVKKVFKQVRTKNGTFKTLKKISGSVEKNISISGMKIAAKKLLSDKYGDLAAKKLIEKTKRGKKKIQKQMTELAAKIRKVVNI